jgi:hypothetical protein
MPASVRDRARLNVTVSAQVLQSLHENGASAPLERHFLIVPNPTLRSFIAGRTHSHREL